MTRHRRLEFLESARWLWKLRNQLKFRRRQFLISGDFSLHRVRRIRAHARNLFFSTPFENALLSGRCLPPAAFKLGAARERGPTGLLFEVLIQCGLLRDLDRLQADSHGMAGWMERAMFLFL